MDLLLTQYYENLALDEKRRDQSEKYPEDYVELKEISSDDPLDTLYLAEMEDSYALFYKKDKDAMSEKCSKIYRCEYNKDPRHMYFYYIGRDMFLDHLKDLPFILVLMLDGQFPTLMQKLTKYEAFCFAIYFLVQREKYGLIKDIKYILENKDIAPFLIYFYDYLETLKWSIYDFSVIEKIESLIQTLQNSGVLEKSYRNGMPFPERMFAPGSVYYFDQDREKIKKLSKVVSVTLMRSKKYNKNIYIFGEIHQTVIPCNVLPFATKWYDAIIDKYGGSPHSIFRGEGKKILSLNNYVLDYIFEIKSARGFFKDILYEGWDYDKLDNSFEPLTVHTYGYGTNLAYFKKDPCLEKNSKNRFDKREHIGRSQCENYRIEQVDIRKIYEIHHNKDISNFPFFLLLEISVRLSYSSNTPVFKWADYIPNVNLKGVEKIYFEKLRENQDAIRKIMILLLTKKNMEELYSLFLNEWLPIVEEEIKKSYLRTEIMNYFKQETYSIIKTFYKEYMIHFENQKIVDKIESQFDKWIAEEDHIILKIIVFCMSNLLLKLGVQFMDTFVFAKIFKKMVHRPGMPHGPDEYRNVLYICGNKHAVNLISFLENQQFYLVNSEKTRDVVLDDHTRKSVIQSCVSIEDFDQPFFKLKGFY